MNFSTYDPEVIAREALAQCDPYFSNSAEYQALRPYETDILGVVLSAFGKYLCRLARATVADELENETRIAYAAMEALCSTRSLSIRSLIMDEAFDAPGTDPDQWKEVAERVGSNTRALYRAWASSTDT